MQLILSMIKWISTKFICESDKLDLRTLCIIRFEGEIGFKYLSGF
jgi:hypothetical protein